MKTLLVLSLAGCLAACATTSTTTTTLAVKPVPHPRLLANANEPAPPAEGPDDVPQGAAQDPNRNPGLLPTPLLRYSAASGTP